MDSSPKKNNYTINKPIKNNFGDASNKVNQRDENKIGISEAETRIRSRAENQQKSLKDLYGFYECSLNEYKLKENEKIISSYKNYNNEDIKYNNYNDNVILSNNENYANRLLYEHHIMELTKSLNENDFTYNRK